MRKTIVIGVAAAAAAATVLFVWPGLVSRGKMGTAVMLVAPRG
jgi:hypothetical protein